MDELLELAMLEEDDDLVMLLYDVNAYKDLRTYVPGSPRFDLHTLTDAQCFANFRFGKNDIPRLFTALNLPDEIILENRCKVDGVDALCVLLRRLVYPNLSDLFKQRYIM